MNALLVAWRASRILPVSVTRGIAASIAWYGWASKAKPARRLEDNLHRVTGIEGKELRRLSRKGMLSAARYYAETFELNRMSGERIDARVRVENREAIEGLIDRDSAFVAVLAHSGNWDLVGAYTCRNIGRVTSVAEVLKPREVFDQFVAAREAVGMQILGHEGGSTFRRLITIGKNEPGVIALLADRDLSGDGVIVDWAGNSVRVAPGPAALSVALGCTLVPVSVYYERLRGAARRRAGSKWGIVMEFGPLLTAPNEADNAEKVRMLSQQWAAWLSQKVQEHPEDWHMLQRFGWVEP